MKGNEIGNMNTDIAEITFQPKIIALSKGNSPWSGAEFWRNK